MKPNKAIGPEAVLDKKKRFLIPCVYHFYQQPPQIVRGEGVWLYDSDGKSYLDLYSGVSVNALGHCHPELTEAICSQLNTVQHTTTIYLTQPMLELARLLEEHDFQVWVVTGAEQDFVRSYIEDAAGIPPERVIGSWTPAVGDVVDGQVSVVRGSVQVYNGHEAKPGNIETRIGRRPVFAAGNSNNDMPMCLYSVTGQHRGLAIWIHHDDSEREYDYDRSTSRMEQLVKDHGSAHEVSIKEDWNRVWKRDLKR